MAFISIKSQSTIANICLYFLFSLVLMEKEQASSASILPATTLSARAASQANGSVVLAYATLWFCIAVALLASQLRVVSTASVVALIGSGKALISLFKYAPQVSHHRQLKSADEWNFASLLLDLGGGIGALLQVLLDAWIAGHVDEITVRPLDFCFVFFLCLTTF